MPDFEKQFAVVIQEKPPIYSFVFGLLQPQHVKACHDRKIFLIGTATNLEEALALEAGAVAEQVEAAATPEGEAEQS